MSNEFLCRGQIGNTPVWPTQSIALDCGHPSQWHHTQCGPAAADIFSSWLVQVIVWRRTAGKPLSKSVLTKMSTSYGPLARYVIMRVAHAPGMPGTFSPPLTSKDTTSNRSRHAPRHVRHARAVMHVGIANPQRQGKRSRHSRRMRNPQFYVSGKRPIWP